MKFARGVQFTVLVFCTSCYGDIHLHKISRKYFKKVFELQRGHEYITELFNVQKVITPKCRLTTVTVLVFCTFAHDDLHLYEVSLD